MKFYLILFYQDFNA